MFFNKEFPAVYMGELRYAVGGSPISHSLSPLLFSLVFHHLKKNEQIPNLIPQSLRLIESVHVDEVLGWGYIEHDQHNPDWALLNSRLDLNTTQLTRLVEEVLTRGIRSSFEGFEPSRKRTPVSNYLPSQYYGKEVWMNLTSPLKHQLQSMAFTAVDKGMDILSVNTLRWTGHGWYCATTDGAGVVDVAIHHGINVATGAVLGLNGGGGSARSIADAWLESGGHVVSLGGRRRIDSSLVSKQLADVEQLDLLIDFDGTYDGTLNAKRTLRPDYLPLNGSLEEQELTLSVQNSTIDGRWMLVGQHLESWRRLWVPQCAEHLPTLEQLMSWLFNCELELAISRSKSMEE
jgi:shikimate 5-dehydrogenase